MSGKLTMKHAHEQIEAAEYQKALKDELDQIAARAMAKYHQYAHDGDPHYSVRRLALEEGVPVWQVIRFQIRKKLISIEGVQDPEKRRSEIRELAHYAVMLNMIEAEDG